MDPSLTVSAAKMVGRIAIAKNVHSWPIKPICRTPASFLISKIGKWQRDSQISKKRRTSESMRIKAWKSNQFCPHGDCPFTASAEDLDLIVWSELACFFSSNRSLRIFLNLLQWHQSTSYESEKGEVMTNYSLVSSIHAKTSLFSHVPKGGFHPNLYLYLDSSRTKALTFTYKIWVVAYKILHMHGT